MDPPSVAKKKRTLQNLSPVRTNPVSTQRCLDVKSVVTTSKQRRVLAG